MARTTSRTRRSSRTSRDADLDELQAIFDRAAPKRYDRADVDQKDRLGFLAQDLQHGGVTGKTMWGGKELLTLDYGKLTAVHDLAPAAERAPLDSVQRELAQQGPCSGSQGKLCHNRVAFL